MSKNDQPTPTVSWTDVIWLRIEAPRWERQALQEKLREMAEILSRTLMAEVNAVALFYGRNISTEDPAARASAEENAGD